MADTNVPISQGIETLISTAVGVASNVAQLAIKVGTAPLALLPAESRQSVRNAAGDIITAVDSIQSNVSKTLSGTLQDLATTARTECCEKK